MSTNPTPQQRRAIEHSPSPLMILAGAGTGKTFTLVRRMVNLIKVESIDPRHILMITYTERAAGELKEKVVAEVGPKAEKMTVGTFHSICYQIVKDFGAASLPPRLLDESEAIYMLLESFDELGPFESADFALEPEKAVVKSFLPFFNRCRDELIDPSTFPDPENAIESETVEQINDLRRVYTRYQKMKESLNVVDYGDMIVKAHHLLVTDETALGACRERYRHIIVDEFQDNNFALNEIVKQISGERESVTVVGDDDQVIYSFRGASAYNIKAFRNTYGAHEDFLTTPLEINFRSHQQILDVANDIIRRNEDRQVKSLVAHEGRQGPLPTLVCAEGKDQPSIIVEQIEKLVSEGFAFADMAVLCRTRNQSKKVADQLLGANIPANAEFRRFFDIPEVKTLVAWCQVVGQGKDREAALYRLLREALGDEAAYDLFSRFDSGDSTPRLDLFRSMNGHLGPEVRHILKQVEVLQELSKKKNAAEMVWEICEQTELLRPLVRRHQYDDQVALLTVGKLMRKTQDFCRGRLTERGLRRFNRYLESIIAAGDWPAELPRLSSAHNTVTVQTIHGVKGGEFPVVFVPFNRSGSFPLAFRSEPWLSSPLEEWLKYSQHTHLSERDHHLQEERRLLYVAITRAKERLFLLAPSKATSHFVKALDKSLVKMIDLEGRPKAERSEMSSDLRKRYQDRLQRALGQDDYANAKIAVRALDVIHRLDTGETIEWGGEPWEEELKQEVSRDFVPRAPETLSLSASAVETYMECPMKYRFKQIDKIPESASRPQLTFGNIIHKVLERFHSSDGDVSEERILQILEEEWQSGEFEYLEREAKLKEQAVEMLIRYADAVSAAAPDVLEAELKFSFDLDNVRISGKIDRIDDTSDGKKVVDYKTSKRSSPAKKSIQLAVYSLYLQGCADEQMAGIPDNATLYFLRDEEQPEHSHSFSESELEGTREKIAHVARGIRDGKFEPCVGFHCDWCDYKTLACPAWES